MRVAVLISGRGSNLQALIDDQKGYQICHVISNNFKANGLKIAQKHGITNTAIDWKDNQQAEQILQELLCEINADLVVLAGFMRILSPETLQVTNKVINIHPSLLPKYPGLNTHQQVVNNQDKWHGATVHVVNEELDGGLILAQFRFLVDHKADANQLANELISKEHKLLTTVVGLIANKQISWNDNQLQHNANSDN